MLLLNNTFLIQLNDLTIFYWNRGIGFWKKKEKNFILFSSKHFFTVFFLWRMFFSLLQSSSIFYTVLFCSTQNLILFIHQIISIKVQVPKREKFFRVFLFFIEISSHKTMLYITQFYKTQKNIFLNLRNNILENWRTSELKNNTFYLEK